MIALNKNITIYVMQKLNDKLYQIKYWLFNRFLFGNLQNVDIAKHFKHLCNLWVNAVPTPPYFYVIASALYQYYQAVRQMSAKNLCCVVAWSIAFIINQATTYQHKYHKRIATHQKIVLFDSRLICQAHK